MLNLHATIAMDTDVVLQDKTHRPIGVTAASAKFKNGGGRLEKRYCGKKSTL